ncbi:glycosyltransferase family 39 protein [Streptomyces sp. NPDC050617]|uniref:ArnT family glycosyltransferase n=1 Tax=Streptomyces sp. NPDC050617 TaxID=3154628 RepID=UPI00342FB757
MSPIAPADADQPVRAGPAPSGPDPAAVRARTAIRERPPGLLRRGGTDSGRGATDSGRGATDSGPPGGRRRLLVHGACLLLLAALVRLPSFHRPFWSADEGYLGTEAAMLRAGGRMYADVVDRKPPLVPWLYEACSALAGTHGLLLVRLLTMAALALAAVYTARLAERWLGPWAALPAGVLTVAASAALPAPDAMAATFELFMLPATAAALYYGAGGRYFAAGLAVAVATLTKQVGLAPLLPLAVCALTAPRPRPRRWRDAAALAGGTLIPLLGCAALLGGHRFVFWVFLSSGSYATSPPGAGEVLRHAWTNLACLLTAFAACAALVPLLPRRTLRDRSAAARALVLWLLASAAAVSVGWHYYGHYFLQLIPPMALLALRAVGLACRAPAPAPSRGPSPLRRLATRAGRSGVASAVTLSALAVAAGWTVVAFHTEPPRMHKQLAVARTVSELTSPEQRVFVWGMHPEIYWLAERLPASRYLTAGLLTNFSGGGGTRSVGPAYAVPGAWPVFRRELATAPPCVFVDDSASTPYSLSRYPELRRLLAAGYRPLADIEGARVYQREGC